MITSRSYTSLHSIGRIKQFFISTTATTLSYCCSCLVPESLSDQEDQFIPLKRSTKTRIVSSYSIRIFASLCIKKLYLQTPCCPMGRLELTASSVSSTTEELIGQFLPDGRIIDKFTLLNFSSQCARRSLNVVEFYFDFFSFLTNSSRV